VLIDEHMVVQCMDETITASTAPSITKDRVEKLSRLRARLGNAIVNELLRQHGIEPSPTPLPLDLEHAIKELQDWVPSLPAPPPLRIHDVVRLDAAQFLTANVPNALAAISEGLHIEETDAGDPVAEALCRLAARAYPMLLAKTEVATSSPTTWAPTRLRRRWTGQTELPEYADAAAEMRGDAALEVLFETGVSGLETTFGGSSHCLRLYDPPELLIHGAWRLCLLRGRWGPESFRTAIVEQVDRVRKAASDGTADVPIFCGFSRARVGKPFCVDDVVVRPYAGGLQNSLMDDVDRLDGSYHDVGFVVERPHPWRFCTLHKDADTDAPAGLAGLDWSGVRRWADHLAVAAAAIQVGATLRPHELQRAKSFAGIPQLLWIETADPLYAAASSHLSRDWTWHDEGAPDLSEEAVAYVKKLEEIEENSMRVAVRRLRMALEQPRAWEDALVDAVVAWEALSGDCQGAVTLKTTGFLAKLITSSAHRHQFRSDLSTIYRHRSRVVHGGALDGPDVQVWRDRAITVALVAMKKLVGEHRDLLGHNDRFERFCLDEADA
jgi:hypothetical protein